MIGLIVDLVARQLNIPLFETPTGWKFFGNIMKMTEVEITPLNYHQIYLYCDIWVVGAGGRWGCVWRRELWDWV